MFILIFNVSIILLQKRRQTKEDGASHALPQDFIEQQRAYFAEIDAFELPEEEVTSVDDLDWINVISSI